MDNYPVGHKAAAVIPILDLAQRQHGMKATFSLTGIVFIVQATDVSRTSSTVKQNTVDSKLLKKKKRLIGFCYNFSFIQKSSSGCHELFRIKLFAKSFAVFYCKKRSFWRGKWLKLWMFSEGGNG